MSFVIPDDVWGAAQMMPKGQRDEFLLAVVEYGFTGATPTSVDPWVWAFELVKGRIDMSTKAHEKGKAMAAARYAKQPAAAPSTSSVHKQPAAAECLEEKRGEENRTGEKSGGREATGRRTFAPPTVEEVAEFCASCGIELDPSRFVDYYAAQGWRLSNGCMMRDWHAAARNWARRDKPTAQREDEFSAYSLTNLRVVGGDAT